MDILKKQQEEQGKIPEHLLIERIIDGEKQLFEILIRRYNQTLFRVLKGYLKDEDDIMDAMQETYLKAYLKMRQFRGTSSFSTWLIRIGINEALQKLRTQKKAHLILPFSQSNNNEVIFGKTTDSENMNPEKQAINKEMKNIIEKAIDQLPEKYKLVYILKEIEGLSHHEIAECLELTEANIKVRLHRSKKILKEMLFLQIENKEALFEFGNHKCDQIVDFVMNRI